MIGQTNAVDSQKGSVYSSDNPSDLILHWFEIFHRWNFITAQAVEEKPNWATIKEYPLSPTTLFKRWRDSHQLVGVRFGAETSYLMIDIDINSYLHPDKDVSAFRGMIFALADIGLDHYILVRSSKSGGIHVYFPLSESLPSFKLAFAVKCQLEVKGLKLAPGQLEIFPNIKSSRNVKYNAHRLPLQVGSDLLDADLQPMHSSLENFIQSWCATAKKQDLDLLKHTIETDQSVTRENNPHGSRNCIEWKNRLEETLERGWTGVGQTDRIIREACQYAIVFKALDWDECYEWVYKTVVELPGYQQFCNHKSDIKKRVKDWVKTNKESGRYYPCSKSSKKIKEPKASTNQERSAASLRRIKQAIATIVKEKGQLPEGAKKRQILICKTAQCSASTLRKHLALWHPDYQDQGSLVERSKEAPEISKEESDWAQFDLSQPDKQQGCVTPEPEGVSSNYAQPDEWQGCVTPEPEGASSNYGVQSDFYENSESHAFETVTYPALLSVYVGDYVLDLDPRLWELFEKESDFTLQEEEETFKEEPDLTLLYNWDLDPSLSDSWEEECDSTLHEKERTIEELEPSNQHTSCSDLATTIAVGDVIKRPPDRAFFKVTEWNSSNRVWAQWVYDRFVMLH